MEIVQASSQIGDDMSQYRFSSIIFALNGSMLLFAVGAVLGYGVSYDPSLSRFALIGILISVVLYFILVYVARSPQWAVWLAGLVVLAATAFALFFILQYGNQGYTEIPSFFQRFAEILARLPYLGVYIHQNSAATILEMMIPLSAFLLFSAPSRLERWLWLGCALVMLIAMLLTSSRGALVGLVLAGIIALAVQAVKEVPPRRAVIQIVIVLVVLVVAVIGISRFGNRLPFLSSALQTLGSRSDVIRNSLYLIGDYPFTGIGLGDTFAMVYSRFGLMIFVPFLTYSFNLPLAVWLGQGLLGLVAFVGIIVLFYRHTLEALYKTDAGPVFHGVWIGVTATLVHGLVDARQYVESPLTMPALLGGIGLVIACASNALHESEREFIPQESSKRPLLLAAILIPVVLAGVFVVFNRPIQAMWYTNLGALDENRADTFILPDLDRATREALFASAEENYQKALVILPDFPNANRRLANLRVGQDEFEDSVPMLEQAYARESSFQAAIKGLGLAYVWAGQLDEAAQTLNQLSNPPEMIQELYTWQNFRAEQGYPLLSAYAMDTAERMTDYIPPEDIGIWVFIGERYAEAGKPDEARAWYQRVLEHDPNNADAQARLAEMES